MAKIAFIGLGHMGLPMAATLLHKGHQVVGFDKQESALAAFHHLGGRVASCLEQAIEDCDIVISMLQSGDQVTALCLGEKGIYPLLAKNTLHIDCSSIDVDSARTIHQQAALHALKSLDAPVSGGVAGAKAGTLTFMVGGEEAVFNEARILLEDMGRMVIYTGAAGNGQAAKICNNMILGSAMIAVSEAFTLGHALGLAEDKLLEVVNNASGECWVTRKYMPVPGVMADVPANNNYQPGFTVAMMLKDLLLGQHSAAMRELNLPLSAKAASLYEQFKQQGHGALDFSAIITQLTGKETVHG